MKRGTKRYLHAHGAQVVERNELAHWISRWTGEHVPERVTGREACTLQEIYERYGAQESGNQRTRDF